MLSLINHVLIGQSVLDEYIKAGLSNNLALQNKAIDVAIQLEKLEQARANYMPQASFKLSYILAGGGRTINFPAGDLFNPVYSTLNELLEEERFPTDLENVNEQLNPNKFHDTRVEVNQSLFNSNIFYNEKINQSMLQAKSANKRAFENELTKDIKVAYYEYLKTEELLEIYSTTEKVLKELLRVNTSLYKNDKATKDIIYDAEYELADLQKHWDNAKKLNHQAASYFNFLLNRDLESAITIDSALDIPESFYMALEDLKQQAVSSRSELDQVRSNIEATEYNLKRNQSSRLPQLSAGLSFGYQGFDYSLSDNQDYYLAGFNFSVPIFTGFNNKSKIQEARLNLDKIRNQHHDLKKSVQLEVINAYRAVQEGLSRVKSNRKAVRSAGRSFKIIKSKYEAKAALLVEFLEAENRWTTSRLQLAIAKYDLLIRQAILERTIANQE